MMMMIAAVIGGRANFICFAVQLCRVRPGQSIFLVLSSCGFGGCTQRGWRTNFMVAITKSDRSHHHASLANTCRVRRASSPRVNRRIFDRFTVIAGS